jgi:cytosine/adenosine deaminase-related metal-dependent hydrolase
VATLDDRVEAITEVAKDDNPDLRRYNVYQVEDLLSRLDHEDLSDKEAQTIADALGAAYRRKQSVVPVFIDTHSHIDFMLSRLDYNDLLHTELVTVALALAEAYGRKLGSVGPAPRLVFQWPHRSTG